MRPLRCVVTISLSLLISVSTHATPESADAWMPSITSLLLLDEENAIDGLWSDPNTWPNGNIPAADDDVTIPMGVTVTVNDSTPSLGRVTINGQLVFTNADINFTAHSVVVNGLMQVGTIARPISNTITITLTGTDPAVTGTATRGIMVTPTGTLDLHGVAPSPTWTKLSMNSVANAASLTVVDSLNNWNSGDEIVIAPTDFIRIGRTERSVIGSSNNTQLNLNSPIVQPRWGVLQYINSNGVTLNPTTGVTDKVVDQRAEVGNISRNIIIQSIDDWLWQQEGFGAHVMVMSQGQARVDGVQFKRGGQAGIVGRYPFHWHRWSYDNAGNATGDVTGQYIKNSAIVSSSQRCVVIHATNGALVEDNICYDIRGHAMFLEDAVERRNIFDGNLILHTNEPLDGKRLQAHENSPSGFWVTHPDNTLRNNAVADSSGFGFWLAFPENTLGLSKAVSFRPFLMPFGAFDDNVAHSNNEHGLMFDKVQKNDAGGTKTSRYSPMDNEGESLRFTMNRFIAYKHERSRREAAFWNRVSRGSFIDFIISDHTGVAFAGASRGCEITRGLVVGTTLNNANIADQSVPPMGAASYHSLCSIHDNIFVNLPAVKNRPSGVFSTSDYYITGVDKGLISNSSNRLINSHAGYREPSRHDLPLSLRPQSGGRENYAIAGALWDPHGYWGEKEHYWVYDNPFYTDGGTCAPVKDKVHDNDKSCFGPYYGVSGSIRLNKEDSSNWSNKRRPIKITRLDNNTELFIDDGRCTPFLGAMRNFSVVKGGTYKIDFPAGEHAIEWNGNQCPPEELYDATPPPSAFTLSVSNLLTDNDTVTMVLPFRSGVTPIGYITSKKTIGDGAKRNDYKANESRDITQLATKAELLNTNQSAFWYDPAGSQLWLKVNRMGLPSNTSPLYGLLHFVFESE